MLEKVNSTEDLKNLSLEDKKVLAEDIRKFILEIVSENGGHLASNLGVVELTIALHSVFNVPEDKIVWDVGHQAYVHKILTGRKDKMDTLRKLNGIAGFPKTNESEADCFNTGHSSTSISAALGMPGGVSMVATLPADIIQYYGYMLRAAQKLMYLYGFPEINVEEKNQTFDSETLNILIICLGTMYGVAGANNAIKAMAAGLSKGVSKKIMSTALTKGTLYPMVKSIAKWFGVKMTKKMLAGMVQKSLPVVGGIVGGGITYVSFKPCCDKLKESLQDTMLSNPDHIETEKENIIIDNIEVSEEE